LIEVVKRDEMREIQVAGIVHRCHMILRSWRVWYKVRIPQWIHIVILASLHLGMAALTVLKEVKGYNRETETWIKVINGVLVGLTAFMGGLPLLFRPSLLRGYPTILTSCSDANKSEFSISWQCDLWS
jgi:hypothetical protein